MQILTDLSQAKPEPSVLTIGSFDGVHRGHRYLIDRVCASARRQGLRTVLLTFYPHPSVVLRGAEPYFLTTREEKLVLLSELDLDLIIVQPFTPGLAQTRAHDYVDLVIKNIGMVELWLGPDFALGYRREGDIPFLRQMGEKRGFTMNVLQPLKLDGVAIKSSRIRQALREGDVTLAARCLGRPYSLQGPISIGAQRGRTIGFPTANVIVPEERAVPANGVYAAWAKLHPEPHIDPAFDQDALHQHFAMAGFDHPQDEIYRAVVNIGNRPTFDNGPRTIEAHLLDFDREMYGQRVKLEFVKHLRSERKFDGIEELVSQIRSDVGQARELLHDA
jgi:riboflavin kinase/FMN adenylyltransferase